MFMYDTVNDVICNYSLLLKCTIFFMRGYKMVL